MKNLGQYIRSVREAHEIGLREFAVLIGMSPTYISGVETGKVKPTAKYIRKVSSALDLSLAVLMRHAGLCLKCNGSGKVKL